MPTVATINAAEKAFTLRLPADVKRRLRVDAARHDRSMNEHISNVLDQHLPPVDQPA